MNINRDIKGWTALGMLFFGTFCTILALSTDHWYNFNMAVDEYSGENYHTPGVNMNEYMGLWKMCMSVKIRATPGDTHGWKLSKCFNIDDWKGMINYLTKLASIAEETGFGGNKFQNTYSNTYENKGFEVTRRRKRRNVNELWSGSGGLEKFRKMMYPDYLKSIQAFEVLALLSGVTAIGIWIAYIVMSTRARKGVASTVFKIIEIVFILLTASFHSIGVVVWVIKHNERTSNVLDQSHTGGVEAYFGWSWGMAIAAAVLHLMSIIPVALTKTNQPDDMTERVLPPNEVWMTPNSRDDY